MKFIVFEYLDEFCKDGKFHRQACICESVEKCIELYGLGVNCEYRIISVEDYK